LMARLLIEQMADAVKCLLSPLETPVLNLGWGMGYPDPGVRNLLGHSQTTTQIVCYSKATARRLYAGEYFLIRRQSVN